MIFVGTYSLLIVWGRGMSFVLDDRHEIVTSISILSHREVIKCNRS